MAKNYKTHENLPKLMEDMFKEGDQIILSQNGEEKMVYVNLAWKTNHD